MIKKIGVLCLGLCVSLPLLADDRDEITARIKPVGQVQIDGDDSTIIKAPVTAEKPAQKKTAAMDGETVYKKYCVTCHSTGLAGSPKFHDKSQWAPRQKQGMDTLLKHAITGIKAMPPKGTCMSCSDAELKAAIKYMLPK